MNAEKKATIAELVKPILKKYGIKGSLSVSNHSSICLNIKSGPIDIIGNYNATVAEHPDNYHVAKDYLQVNVYWIQDHFTGVAREFLSEAVTALKGAGYYNNSDAMTDYFDVAYYFEINVGRWNKPYELTA